MKKKKACEWRETGKNAKCCCGAVAGGCVFLPCPSTGRHSRQALGGPAACGDAPGGPRPSPRKSKKKKTEEESGAPRVHFVNPLPLTPSPLSPHLDHGRHIARQRDGGLVLVHPGVVGGCGKRRREAGGACEWGENNSGARGRKREGRQCAPRHCTLVGVCERGKGWARQARVVVDTDVPMACVRALAGVGGHTCDSDENRECVRVATFALTLFSTDEG